MSKYYYLVFTTLFFMTSCTLLKPVPAPGTNQVKQIEEMNKSLQLIKDIAVAKGEEGKMPKEEMAKIITAIDSKVQENKTEIVAVKKMPRKGKKKYLVDLDKKLTTQQRSIESMRDLFDLDRFTAFNAAKFFNTGEFVISKQAIGPIKKDLEPLADAIIQYINSHSNQKLKAVIGIYGYSDEQAISNGGRLYKILMPMMDNQDADSNEMNKKLSELRAKSLAGIIEDLIEQKKTGVSDLSRIKFEVNWVGRGIELPGKLTDPKVNDERRRIVTFIWSVYPDELFK